MLDDGSTDDTVEVIKSYQDKRIKLIENKNNKGVGYRLRQAVDLVETPYIAKVDSDDISHKDRFQKQLDFMKENKELDIIKSLFKYFPDTPEVENSERYKQYKAVKEKEHNTITSPELIAKELPKWLCVIHTSYFAKSTVIKDIGYPDSRYAEDYTSWIQLASATACNSSNNTSFGVFIPSDSLGLLFKRC
ncbi:glycosyltransferase family 2 protein, partial [Marinospirillum insulare]|uniref:glycosyltransferase family 2 protein n=1 Tax=Marinospirillum insulare TaxID=217169 RepID=UPI0024E05BC0